MSCQTATHFSPQEAATRVRAHENEHVRNEQVRADKEGRRVVSQSVSIHTSCCPECGRIYISGGKTTTITVEDNALPESGTKSDDSNRLLDVFA